jgi:hypothetical protein
MSKAICDLPAVSCLTAIAALVLGLACWAVQIDWLSPAMAVSTRREPTCRGGSTQRQWP